MDSGASREIKAAVEAITSGGSNKNMSMAESLNHDAAAIVDAGTSSQTESITYMDPCWHKAAAEGDFNTLAAIEDLHRQLTPKKNTVLHIYITTENVTEGGAENKQSTRFVSRILEMCPPLLLQVNAKGETPLHIAARYGHYDTVKVLIELAKARHEQGIEDGAETAQQMLRMTNNEKDTVLHDAVRFNHSEVVELLINEDPGFSYPANNAGETPLYLAAERGFRHLVSQILNTCTSPDHDGPSGLTALHAAVINSDEEMTKNILKKKGALTKKVDQQGWTPLHYAAHFDYLPMVELLLKNDMSACDMSAAYLADRDCKRTALHIAAARGYSSIMKEIISCYPDCCELVDKRGWNVLHFATESYYSCTVDVILKNPSLTYLLNEKNNDGNTPLHQLAVAGDFNPFLISHPRVDKLAYNNENLNALDICLTTETWLGLKGTFLSRLKSAGAREGRRNITYQDGSRKKLSAVKSRIPDFILKAQDTHLIVATLIATVTFAAAFTLPGGYITDKGQDQGTAILKRNVAFKGFVISDTIAMVLSSTAVFIYIFLPLIESKAERSSRFLLATQLNTFATGAMVVAFVTGLYAVLENASGLVIAICVIACFFFFYYIIHFALHLGGVRSLLKK